MHDAISSLNLRVTVTTKSSPLHTILVLFPHESLPLPIPEEEELPLEPLNKFEKKLEAEPVPDPKPVPGPELLPTPDFTILVDVSTVGSFSSGSYIVSALSKFLLKSFFELTSIIFCLNNVSIVSSIIILAFAVSSASAPPY